MMLRALPRAALGNLRRHRLQNLLIVVMLVAATTALTLGVTVRRLSAAPFARLFAETHGAHLWLAAGPGVDLTAVLTSATAVDHVAESAGPFAVGESAFQMTGGPGRGRLGLKLLALPADLPATGRPLLQDGRWLAGAGEIVLAPVVARFVGLKIGDELRLGDANNPVTLQVVGIADHAGTWRLDGEGMRLDPYGFVLPETFARVVSDPAGASSLLGVRLTDPDESRAVAAALLAELPPGAAVTIDDSRDLAAAFAEDNELNALLLAVFSAFALAAAGLVIANAIGGRIVDQARDIGILKAIGFTPRDIVILFLVEHLALGLVGAGIGLVAGALLTPLFEDNLSELLATVAVSPFDPAPLLLVLVVVQGAVALFTLLPAVRAGRLGAARAMVRGIDGGRSSPWRLTRLAGARRVPISAALGVKDAFARPVRAWIAVAALTLTVVTLIFSIGMEATIRDIARHPERWGEPYDLAVEPRGQSAAEIAVLLDQSPDVATYSGRLPVDARLAGQSTAIQTLALSGDLTPYRAAVVEGRLYAGPGEAVAGQGLLDLARVGIGETIHLSIAGRSLDLLIVGRIVDANNGGRTLLYDLEAYRAAVDPAAVSRFFAVQLRDGVEPFAAMDRLASATSGGAAIRPIDLGAGSEFDQIRAVMFALDLILAGIGVVNLVAATLLTVRERFRAIGLLKALGLTPRQAMVSVLSGVATLALTAVLIGIPLGLVVTRLLFDEIGRRVGVGPGLGVLPDARLLLPLGVAALALALAGGVVPAHRAASLRVGTALRYE